MKKKKLFYSYEEMLCSYSKDVRDSLQNLYRLVIASTLFQTKYLGEFIRVG